MPAAKRRHRRAPQNPSPPAAAPGAVHPLAFLAAGFFAGTVFLLLAWQYLAQGPLFRFDESVLRTILATRTPEGVAFFRFISDLVAFRTIALTGAFVTVAMLWARQRHFLLTFWLAIIGAERASAGLKLFFARVRPELAAQAVAETSYSFPSGHASAAAAFFGFVAYLALRTQRSEGVRLAAVFLAAAATMMVDVSRVYLGAHYVTDVLAGNALGLGVLLAAIAVTEAFLQRLPERPALAPPLLAAVCAVQLLVVARGAGVPAVAPALVSPPAEVRTAEAPAPKKPKKAGSAKPVPKPVKKQTGTKKAAGR